MPRPLAAAVVLVSAGAVLVLEILALRLAAPYVGLTLDTYSAAIGVALLGIALGAWWGGRLADRVDPRLTLGPTLMVAGGLVFLARPITDALGPHVQGAGPKGALALVGAATAPAIIVLSMAHPAVVKLRLAALERTGSTVGGLSAVGTLGALGGTFLTGFVLLGHLTTREIATATGVFVVLLGIVVAVVLGRGGLREAATALVALPALGVLLTADGPCDRETRHYCARVEALGPSAKLLMLDNLLHAQTDPGRPERLMTNYTVMMADVVTASFPAREPLRALHVGGGGFAFPRFLAATRPGSAQVVLELDPGVVQLARDDLALRTGPALRVRTGDARMSILDEPPGRYDLVVGDAFATRSVPWHLATREFVEEVRRVLRRGGVYVMNMIDAGEQRFVRAELATLRAVFGHVALLAFPGQSGNFVAAASDAPLPMGALRERARRLSYQARDADPLIGDATVLTDEFAPVDQLMSQYARSSEEGLR